MSERISVEELAKRFSIGEQHLQHLDASRPLPVRLLAARGLAPIPPKVLLAVQYLSAAGFLGDEQQLMEAGKQALLKAPTDLLINNIDDRSHPKLLEFLASERPVEQKLDEALAMRSSLNERTFCMLAERADPRVLEIVSNNQEMLLCYPVAARFIANNPAAGGAMVERIVSFLRLHGEDVDLREPEPESAEAPAPAQPTDEAEQDYLGYSEAVVEWMAEHPLYRVLSALGVRLRPEYFWGADDVFDFEAERGPEVPDGPVEAEVDASFKFSIEDDTELFEEALLKESEDEEEEGIKAATMEGKIKDMKTGQKIKLAYTGNSEARMILVKDTNKVVAEAVLKSGRLSDREVVKIAQMRSVADDVIRAVARNKQWTGKYAVRHALVSNPKTPMSTAVSMLRTLNDRDIKLLSKNRNINPGVAQMAKKMMKAKEERRK